jgi:broad specificity phosphatase PhoE
MRKRLADRAHVAHDVELPIRVPLVVADLLEARVPRNTDVVDEDVQSAQLRGSLGDDPFGLAGMGQVGDDMRLLAHAGPGTSSTRDDAGALVDELLDDDAADPTGRAGDEATLSSERQIHATTVSGLPTTLVLIRHGETDWNRENRFQGHADPPLNDAGRAQARALAAELGNQSFAALYTSPLRRAAETAAILASELGVEPVSDEALEEVDVGSWSGLTRDQVEERFPDGYARWLEYGHGWDDGETYEELGGRVVAGLLNIGARHPDEALLAVTHGGPIRSALAAAEGVPFGEARRSIHVIGNCAVVRLAVGNAKLERVD